MIGVIGTVINRPAEAVNNKMITGNIDKSVSKLEVYNESDNPPFDINDRFSASEEHRLKYRYLELRTRDLQKNIRIRDKALLATRKYFSKNNFIEIETPILMKSTPEGARDFLVPSESYRKIYTSPQSPQTYKQLLMVSGFDKYFQIMSR